MRQISPPMQALLNSDGIASLATFWKITRQDGVILGFTDWTADVTEGTVLYQANTGLTKSALQQRVDLAVPNEEVTGILTSDSVTSRDIRGGKYNGALFQVFMGVPTDPDFLTYGRILLPGAFLGEIRIQDGVFVAEVRGLSYPLSQSFIEVYTPICRVDFCGTQCTLNAANFSASGTISQVATQNFTVASQDIAGPGMSIPVDPSGALPFIFGLFTFTSGENKGLSFEILNQVPVTPLAPYWTVEFALPTPYPINNGDTFTAVTGCSKTIYRCIQYGNSANMRAEPFIPGLNQLFDVGIVSP